MELPNLEYLEQMADGDLEFINEIFSVLKREIPIEHKKYQELIANNAFMEAAALVHKIKHKFIIIGLKESYESANEHESMLKKGKATLHTKFLESIERVNNFIKELNL